MSDTFKALQIQQTMPAEFKSRLSVIWQTTSQELSDAIEISATSSQKSAETTIGAMVSHQFDNIKILQTRLQNLYLPNIHSTKRNRRQQL